MTGASTAFTICSVFPYIHSRSCALCIALPSALYHSTSQLDCRKDILANNIDRVRWLTMVAQSARRSIDPRGVFCTVC